MIDSTVVNEDEEARCMMGHCNTAWKDTDWFMLRLK